MSRNRFFGSIVRHAARSSHTRRGNSDLLETVYRNDLLTDYFRGFFDLQGRLVVSANSTDFPINSFIIRLSPGSSEGLDAGYDNPQPEDLDVDVTGDYGFITDRLIDPYPVTRIDSTDPFPDPPETLADLLIAFPGVVIWSALQVHPEDNDIYLAPDGATGLAVLRDDGTPEWLIPFDAPSVDGAIRDMHFALPEPRLLLLQITVLLGLAALRGARTRQWPSSRVTPRVSSTSHPRKTP